MIKKIDYLAKSFSEIHSNSFVPFYDEVESTFWYDLPEISMNHKEQLDKEFFVRMAHQVFDVLKSEKNKQEALAKILYDIHASQYVPFYISKENFDK